MKVYTHHSLSKLKTAALVFLVEEGKQRSIPSEAMELVPKSALENFEGKSGQVVTVYTNHSIERVVLIGRGEAKKGDDQIEVFRRSLALAIKVLTKSKISEFALYLEKSNEELIKEAIYIAGIAHYSHAGHSLRKENPIDIETIQLVAGEKISESTIGSATHGAGILIESMRLVRDLVNAPSNEMTPKKLAQTAIDVAKDHDELTVTVFGKKQLQEKKFEALLAVAKGSNEEPQLITLDYNPKGVKKTIALVGKGVTFDTGGINIKPSEGMDEMKMDMAGGAAVIGALEAIAHLKPKVRVIGVVPTTENMPSGNALKPSDVIGSFSGKTIEVANTDAEGRLILADGLAWAQTFKPDYIIDVATLTGAALVALGHEYAAVIGNNQKFVDLVFKIGQEVGEKVWQLPLDDDYREHIKSDIADVKNLGKGRLAGTIAGAAFLDKFVDSKTPWAHIDLAGTAMTSREFHYWPKGGTGWGMRLLVELVEELAG